MIIKKWIVLLLFLVEQLSIIMEIQWKMFFDLQVIYAFPSGINKEHRRPLLCAWPENKAYNVNYTLVSCELNFIIFMLLKGEVSEKSNVQTSCMSLNEDCSLGATESGSSKSRSAAERTLQFSKLSLIWLK